MVLRLIFEFYKCFTDVWRPIYNDYVIFCHSLQVGDMNLSCSLQVDHHCIVLLVCGKRGYRYLDLVVKKNSIAVCPSYKCTDTLTYKGRFELSSSELTSYSDITSRASVSSTSMASTRSSSRL